MNGITGWVSLLISVAIAAMAGWDTGRAPLKVELATLKASHSQERAAQATAAYATLAEAQTRGDLLSAGLLTQQTHIDRLKQEKTRAIAQVTTGSACLREPALRLLNSAPGLSVAGLPPGASGTLTAGGAVASDTDISFWAIDAGAAYTTCRVRLDALIDWHTGQPTPAPVKP